MNRVLVTGGAGFIGFHLSKRLADRGITVHILDNLSRSDMDFDLEKLVEKENVSFFEKDVTDLKTWKELPLKYYDAVYHFAALNGTENFYNRPVDVLKVGSLSVIYMLDWVVNHKRKPKIIYSSSSEVYASTVNLLGENFPIPTPETINPSIEDVRNVRWSYASGKLIGEVAFFSYAKSYGLSDFSIVRFANIYGPRMGNDHVVSQFIDRYLKNQNPFMIYGGTNTRSFCYIDDALNALDKIADASHDVDDIINIGNDDEEIKIQDLAKMLFRLFGNNNPTLKIESAPDGSVKRRCPNIDKIKSLGYRKSTPLNEGLKITYDWYERRYNFG